MQNKSEIKRLEDSEKALSPHLIETNPEPEEKEGAFIGQAQTNAGEIIYCYIVRQNHQFWDEYCKQSIQIVKDLEYLVREMEVKIEENIISYEFNHSGREGYKRFGFASKKEFDEFINWLGPRTLTIFPDGSDSLKEEKMRVLDAIRGAVNEIKRFDYVCYLGKIENYYPDKLEHDRSGRDYSLHDYITRYKNLLMCVGVSFNRSAEVYEVRGIFRNPYNMLEGSYKNSSMILHGFMGAVAKKYYPEKKEEEVRPMYSQLYLICQHIQESDIRFPNYKTDDPRNNELYGNFNYEGIKDINLLKDGSRGGGLLNTVYIKIDALAECYYKATRHFYARKLIKEYKDKYKEESGKMEENKTNKKDDEENKLTPT